MKNLKSWKKNVGERVNKFLFENLLLVCVLTIVIFLFGTMLTYKSVKYMVSMVEYPACNMVELSTSEDE